jgi:hypothetical protein
MDDKSSILNVDCSSVLKIVCGPPGIGAEKSGKHSRTYLELRSTYIGAGSVALECAAMDLDISITGIDSSALKVACGPPGVGAKF